RRQRQTYSEERVHCLIRFAPQLTLYLSYQAIEFIEHFAIAFADGVHDASEQWLNSAALAEQPVDNVFANSVIELVATDRRRIQKRAAVFSSGQQVLFVQTVERRHQGRVRDALFERKKDVTHANFVPLPGLFEDFALQFAECERRDLSRPAKSTQKKSRSFHGVSIFQGLSVCCQPEK